MRRKVFKPEDAIPLQQESRFALTTSEAAYHLNRAEQTLRAWAMRNDGPVKCMRINGRLAWPVSEIRQVLGVE